MDELELEARLCRAIVRTSDAEVRAVMLEHCGEPDLGELAKPAPPRRA